jgi:hypothetical protein
MFSRLSRLRLPSVLLALVLAATTLGGRLSERSATAHAVRTERKLREPPLLTLKVNGKKATSVDPYLSNHEIAVPLGSAVTLVAITTYLPKGWKLGIERDAGSAFVPDCSTRRVTKCTATLTYPGDPAKVTDWAETILSAGIGPAGYHLGPDPKRPLGIWFHVATAATVYWCNPQAQSTSLPLGCTEPNWREP